MTKKAISYFFILNSRKEKQHNLIDITRTSTNTYKMKHRLIFLIVLRFKAYDIYNSNK